MSCDVGRLGSIFRVVVQRIIGIFVLWEVFGREVTPAKKTVALLVSKVVFEIWEPARDDNLWRGRFVRMLFWMGLLD